MKLKILIVLGLAIVYACLNFKKEANATQNTQFNESSNQACKTLRREFLIARKIVCPSDGSPCYEVSRGGGIRIITPPRGSLLNNKPTFVWTRVANAKDYIVRLTDRRGILWEKPANGSTESSYPEEQNALQPGFYTLNVKTSDLEENIEGEINFRILSKTDKEEVEKQVQSIYKQNLNFDEKVLKITQLYKAKDLIAEAIEILETAVKNNSQTGDIYQMLGDLYWKQVKYPQSAEKNYQQALKLAIETNDTKGQAEAQKGLAIVNAALKKNDEVMQNLQAASSNYQKIKSVECVESIEKQIRNLNP
ncbi:MAG: hypothetical protein QNJ47_01925 [Nostocaceae cyanobacterium]|nr:hypothetical protein [Nostocaceae cyanobacterium]